MLICIIGLCVGGCELVFCSLYNCVVMVGVCR